MGSSDHKWPIRQSSNGKSFHPGYLANTSVFCMSSKIISWTETKKQLLKFITDGSIDHNRLNGPRSDYDGIECHTQGWVAGKALMILWNILIVYHKDCNQCTLGVNNNPSTCSVCRCKRSVTYWSFAASDRKFWSTPLTVKARTNLAPNI